MEPKKSKKANLEQYRPIFLMFGIALSLLLVSEVLQWQSEFSKPKPKQREIVEVAGITIPITVPEKPEIPKQKKKLNTKLKPRLNQNFKPVPNNSPEADPKIDIDSLGLDSIGQEPFVGEVPDPVMPMLVQNMARPLACRDLRDKEAQMECFNRWIFQYLSEEIEYPAMLRNLGVEERLFMEFVINEFGEVQSIEAVRGKEQEFIKEAKRVLESMPPFEPASQQGNPVPVRIIIPVNFKLQ